MVEFEYDGQIIGRMFDLGFLPCVGDEVIVGTFTYTVKSRTFRYNNKVIKIVLKK